MSVTLKGGQVAALRELCEEVIAYNRRPRAPEDWHADTASGLLLALTYAQQEPPACGCAEVLDRTIEPFIRECVKAGVAGADEAYNATMEALSRCAGTGESGADLPTEADLDGMQRWLDQAIADCDADDPRRRGYLDADVRILAAARAYRRAKSGEPR